MKSVTFGFSPKAIMFTCFHKAKTLFENDLIASIYGQWIRQAPTIFPNFSCLKRLFADVRPHVAMDTNLPKISESVGKLV